MTNFYKINGNIFTIRRTKVIQAALSNPYITATTGALINVTIQQVGRRNNLLGLGKTYGTAAPNPNGLLSLISLVGGAALGFSATSFYKGNNVTGTFAAVGGLALNYVVFGNMDAVYNIFFSEKK
jgi:hypothetical protein